MPGLSISVVIPAYNEQEAVGPVVEGVGLALGGRVGEFEIIVVDDGSTDGTAEAARKSGATVLSHPVNRGYGQALTTGIQAAQHEWMLMIDADSSYPTTEIPKLLEFAPAFDLVIGARTGAHFWGSSAQAFRRKVYIKMTAFIVGEAIPDANSGLRLVRRSLALATGPVNCLGYSFTTTMTLSFLKAGRFVKYVPIAFQVRTGKSKIRPTRDILRALQIMTQVLIAYNPLKLFVTLASLPGIIGLLLWLGYLGNGSGFWLLCSTLCGLAALQCFMTGCLLDSIRMHSHPHNTPNRDPRRL